MKFWLKLRLHKWGIRRSPALAVLEAFHPNDWYQIAEGWNARAAERKRELRKYG
jgi:hypothetical protein